MDKTKLKDNLGLILGTSIGTVLLIVGIVIFCVYFFATPNYLLIKNNQIVIDLDNKSENGDINKDKYYTFDDSLLTFEESENIISFSIDVDKLYSLNSNFKDFKLDFNFELNASSDNLENVVLLDVGLEVKTINSNNEETSISKIAYNSYPSKTINYSYTFNEDTKESVKELKFETYGNIKDVEGNSVGSIYIGNNLYMSLLGIKIWRF